MDSGTGLVVFCVLTPIILLVVISYANSRAADERNRAMASAHDTYQGALAELKAAPTNPDLKQKALELGRTYSNLTRQGKGVTIYDEAALGNDISAATAAASAPATAGTVQDRLKRLDDLKAAGTITDAEHADRRQKILEEL